MEGNKLKLTVYCKAFDLLSIPKLLHKLSYLGISGKLFEILKSHLTGRQQRVKVESASSRLKSIVSGVPQGSVLGPFLFIVFINDLPSVFEPNVCHKLFADDLKSKNKININNEKK